MAFDINEFGQSVLDQLKIGNASDAAATLKKNLDLARAKNKDNNLPGGQSAQIQSAPVLEPYAEADKSKYLKYVAIGLAAVVVGYVLFKKG